MPTKLNEREYRKIDLQSFETRQMDDGAMLVEGYASVFDNCYPIGRKGEYIVVESIDKRAFDKTDMSDVIMQYDHEGRVFARKSNGTLEVKPDDYGLRISARLDGTTIGRQLYEEITGGYTTKMSFGFSVSAQEKRNERDADGNTIIHRVITGIGKLFDVSAVSLPANDATEISARSMSDGLIADAIEEINAVEERKRRIQLIKDLIGGNL